MDFYVDFLATIVVANLLFWEVKTYANILPTQAGYWESSCIFANNLFCNKVSACQIRPLVIPGPTLSSWNYTVILIVTQQGDGFVEGERAADMI